MRFPLVLVKTGVLSISCSEPKNESDLPAGGLLHDQFYKIPIRRATRTSISTA